MKSNRFDLKKVSRQEIEKADMKLMSAANQRKIESKNMKQNFTVND